MRGKGQYLTPTSTLANDISCKKKKYAQSEAVLNVALVVTKTPTARWRHRPWKLHVWPRVLHLAISSLLQSLLWSTVGHLGFNWKWISRLSHKLPLCYIIHTSLQNFKKMRTCTAELLISKAFSSVLGVPKNFQGCFERKGCLERGRGPICTKFGHNIVKSFGASEI